MGSAFRGALIAGLKTDAIELVPSVPKMFGTYYYDAASVLANPNGRVIIADGRNHIELTDRHYDIIVTDPPPPIEMPAYRSSRPRSTTPPARPT